MSDPWEPHLDALGELIRQQRQIAGHSLRDLASMTDLSSAYLSQLERGLHAPSARVLRSIGHALDISTQTLLTQAGFVESDASEGGEQTDTEAAIRNDSRLTDEQKDTLIRVYRGFLPTDP